LLLLEEATVAQRNPTTVNKNKKTSWVMSHTTKTTDIFGVGLLCHCFHHDDDDDGYKFDRFGTFFEFVLWCIVTWKLHPSWSSNSSFIQLVIHPFSMNVKQTLGNYVIHPFIYESKKTIKKPCLGGY
jgi:hypothetical protein